ncbi:MAG: type II secretion system protein N [Ghiorsea sp.]|nr:type II secretion system protein N [Ghiorsea sp.]
MIQSSLTLTLLPRWIEVALVLLGAWLVAGFIVMPFQMPSSVVKPIASAESQSLQVDDSFLRKVDLFGKPQVFKKTQPISQPTHTPVTVSRLNIKLIGTVVAGDRSAAMVTVGTSKKQAVFFLKEEIQPNVTLIAVDPMAIVVKHGANRERIAIETGKRLIKASAVAAPRRVAPRVPIRTDVLNKRIDRNHLNSQMRNFSTLLSQARVSPHFSNGKPDGFKISDIVKGSLYEEIGLLNGDIIKVVNGESVTGAEQAMRMYRELQSATFIDVEVERNGSMQQISYVIQ